MKKLTLFSILIIINTHHTIQTSTRPHVIEFENIYDELDSINQSIYELQQQLDELGMQQKEINDARELHFMNQNRNIPGYNHTKNLPSQQTQYDIDYNSYLMQELNDIANQWNPINEVLTQLQQRKTTLLTNW